MSLWPLPANQTRNANGITLRDIEQFGRRLRAGESADDRELDRFAIACREIGAKGSAGQTVKQAAALTSKRQLYAMLFGRPKRSATPDSATTSRPRFSTESIAKVKSRLVSSGSGGMCSVTRASACQVRPCSVSMPVARLARRWLTAFAAV